MKSMLRGKSIDVQGTNTKKSSRKHDLIGDALKNLNSLSKDESHMKNKITRSSSTKTLGTNPLNKSNSSKLDNFLYLNYHPDFNAQKKRNPSIHNLNPA